MNQRPRHVVKERERVSVCVGVSVARPAGYPFLCSPPHRYGRFSLESLAVVSLLVAWCCFVFFSLVCRHRRMRVCICGREVQREIGAKGEASVPTPPRRHDPSDIPFLCWLLASIASALTMFFPLQTPLCMCVKRREGSEGG